MKKYRIYCKDLTTGIVTQSMFAYPMPIAEDLKRKMATGDPTSEYWLEEE